MLIDIPVPRLALRRPVKRHARLPRIQYAEDLLVATIAIPVEFGRASATAAVYVDEIGAGRHGQTK